MVPLGVSSIQSKGRKDSTLSYQLISGHFLDRTLAVIILCWLLFLLSILLVWLQCENYIHVCLLPFMVTSNLASCTCTN